MKVPNFRSWLKIIVNNFLTEGGGVSDISGGHKTDSKPT